MWQIADPLFLLKSLIKAVTTTTTNDGRIPYKYNSYFEPTICIISNLPRNFTLA